ncbi:hypothetical protein B0A52_10232 [Exophiala mesophila]|uniref:DUF2264 domain-containing protein n=1 Tax=Exophiala mesophila TaxID=212818 RepID=A0A438MQM0_EXOME|nr:hypothetical protein B0A52_10232 [Exophiala mesophila]
MTAPSSPTPFFTHLNNPLKSRSDIIQACHSLLEPLHPFFCPGCTRLRLGATATRYDETGAQLEGFTRPLWGLASLLASSSNTLIPSTSTSTSTHTHLWLTGLRNGTNPSHPEFWGYAADLDQRMVEMCPLGFALCIAPTHLWDPLTPEERLNVQTWLGSINDREMPNTNWLWFRVFANLGLKKNGAVYSEEKLGSDLDHLDTFYRGDGWSNDGPASHRQMDYYSGSFAIQLLQLLYVKINGGDDPKRADEYRERARLFAKDFVHYWDEYGQPITFGRSLTYRFAMAGFWSAVAFADLELPAPLSWGVVKGLLLRNLRYWSQQKDILTHSGLLTIGYGYPNQFLSENYNSPGSTYWFMLGFVALAVPESHPFWRAEELDYPVSDIPPLAILPHPMHIISHFGGHTFLLSSGQACHYPVRASESKYGKFAYSSAFPYSVPTGGYSLESIGGDNTLALSDDSGETWRVRRQPVNARIEYKDGGVPVLVASWNPWPDVTVDTWLVPPSEETMNWHLRFHRINTKRRLWTSEGAFALNGVARRDGRELGVLTSLDFDDVGEGESECEGRLESIGSALAISLGGVVGIVDLDLAGYVGRTSKDLDSTTPRPSAPRTGKVLDEDANSNLTESRSVLPSLANSSENQISAGSSVWLGTAVFAVPNTVKHYKGQWREPWEKRPEVPAWVRMEITE